MPSARGSSPSPLVFFFSSRRRHTRYIGDWSSDVCSSDLFAPDGRTSSKRLPSPGLESSWMLPPSAPASSRSEERRVGKECTTRPWPAHDTEKKGVAQRESNHNIHDHVHQLVERTKAI